MVPNAGSSAIACGVIGTRCQDAVIPCPRAVAGDQTANPMHQHTLTTPIRRVMTALPRLDVLISSQYSQGERDHRGNLIRS
jgi:hypothetical protein